MQHITTWTTANRRNTILVGVGGLLMLCLACSVASALSSNPASTAQKTAPVTHPRLGDPVATFTAAYGAPDTSTPPDYRYNRACGDGTDWCVTAMVWPEKNGKSFVEFLDIVAPPDGWNMTAAQAFCGAFLPADAKAKRTVQVGGNVDKVYSSATLARIFTADQFQDAQQNPVTPGLFDVLYTMTGGQVSGCTLNLGTQQTSA